MNHAERSFSKVATGHAPGVTRAGGSVARHVTDGGAAMGGDGDSQYVLRRVGLIAILIGSLDVLSMIYAFVNGLDYASSLNVFAIIAGVFLYRGSVTAARVCANFCACLLGMMVTAVVLMPPLLPTLFPFDFLMAFVRHANLLSVPLAFGFLWLGVTVALFVYTNRALTTGAVTSLYGTMLPQPY